VDALFRRRAGDARPRRAGYQAHSQRAPAPGRGKVERRFETIRRQFLVEVTGDGDPARHHVTSLDEVNQLLDHWVHKACHQQHSETGQTPRQR
jgi:putative transposase